MMISNNGVDTMYYGYIDNQGSLIALTDENGTVVEKYAYDPWGARRNPADWRLKDTHVSFITNRGYTGHEHLDAFGIINMNGRVYDPHTAMFFSPDPFVQTPDNWLNYNRYGYCLNNPTKYTDPTGYQLADKNPEWFADGYQNLMNFLGGGGSSGFGMGQNLWNSFIKNRQQGYTGSFEEFSDEYDKNPDSKDGHWETKTVTNWGNTKTGGFTHFWSQTTTVLHFVSNNKVTNDLIGFDPTKLKYDIDLHWVHIKNTDEYTKKWSIKAPDQVAKAMKQIYKSKYGTDLNIELGSLSLEIYIHALLYDNKMTFHTDVADCGESGYDWNRPIWDAQDLLNNLNNLNNIPTHNSH